MRNIKSTIVLVLVAIYSFTSLQVKAEGHGKGDFNASEFILHHVMDAHEWHLVGDNHVGLPIILLDQGLVSFSSSAFNVPVSVEQGDYAVTQDGKYAIFHETIYKTSNGELNFDSSGHPTNEMPLDFSITRNVASMLLSAVLLLLIFGSSARAYKKRGVESAPKKLQSWMEPLVLFVRDEIAKPNINEHKYQRYMPYLLTAFFFIWINNLLGLIPFFPGGSNLTGNIAFTMVMAVLTLIITNFSGNKNYWGHIFNPLGSSMPWAAKVPLYIILLPIEVAGIFIKSVALMIRLFANITAGHIVILAFTSIIFIKQSAGWSGLSIPMSLFISVLELLVAFLQAFIFTMLSALFIGSAVDEAHH